MASRNSPVINIKTDQVQKEMVPVDVEQTVVSGKENISVIANADNIHKENVSISAIASDAKKEGAAIVIEGDSPYKKGFEVSIAPPVAVK